MKIEKTVEENHEAKLVVEVEPEKMESYKRRAAHWLGSPTLLVQTTQEISTNAY